MEVRRYELDEWRKFSREIHMYAFGEDRPPDMETFDFALMVFQNGEPQAYCTCIEFDKYSVYMQHGGSLPAGHGTIRVAKGYAKLVQFLRGHYKNISTRVWNKNKAMMKLALSADLVPTGIDNIFGKIYLTFNYNEDVERK